MIKFGNEEVELTNYEEAQQNYAKLVKNPDSTSEEKATAFSDMMNSLGTDTVDYIKKQVNDKTEAFLDMKKQDPSLTADEIKFVNEVSTDSSLDKPSSTDILVPESVIDRVMEDLSTDHPLLGVIGLKNNGIRLKFLSSDASGAAVWGDFMGDIQGQLKAKFGKESSIQSKLTAYMVLPKDLKDFGAGYIMNYITTEIREAMANAAESAFLSGDGVKKPIGLDRDLSAGVAASDGSGTITYPAKKPVDTLTLSNSKEFAKQIAEVMIKLSKKENGKPQNISGKVIFVMSPAQHYRLEAQAMVQNQAGAFVTALPFNMKVVESQFQADDTTTVFVQGRYDAYEAGNMTITAFDQTLAFEDEMLYTVKHFYYGKARDNNAALVYKLDFSGAGTGTEQTTTGGDTGNNPKA